MHNKLIPIPAPAGPRRTLTQADELRAAIAGLPPSFRTVVHEEKPRRDSKTPPSSEASAKGVQLEPGRQFQASDGRRYVVTQDGSLRRMVSNRGRGARKPGALEAAQRARQVENIERALRMADAGRAARKAPKRRQEVINVGG